MEKSMKTTTAILIAVFLLFPVITSAQEVPNAPNSFRVIEGTSSTNGSPESDFKAPVISEKQKQLENQMLELKKSGTGTESKYLNLQRQIDAIGKQSVTKQGENYNGTISQPEAFQEFDAVGNTAILVKNGMKGIATATEYVGSTAGRIWTVAAFQGTGSSASPDSLRLLYSTNNGTSWILYSLITLGGTDKINYGELDCEIVEPSTGDKYFYCVYGIRATGGTGRIFTGGFSIRITGTFGGSVFAFAWPGDNPSYRYYCPRITSDVASYPSGAWVYVAISCDSIAGSTYINTQKLVRCTSPYTVTPAWTYKAERIWWNSSGNVNNEYLYTDIAFFKNTLDSVIVSFSGVPDSTKIFFSKMAISGISPSVSGQYVGFVGGSEPTQYKYGTRLSSNGNNNGSIICIFKQGIGATAGIKYFRTTNFGNFSDIAGQSVIWSASGGMSMPDIMGMRNANTHRFGFFFWGTVDSLQYVSVNSSGTFTTASTRMNSVTLTTGTYGPAIGTRFVTGDSCFALYSASGPTNVWSAQGCSGVITNAGNISTPVSYNLSQNYPNPFNPVTQISFAIPKQGLVTLKVFNILGQQVATLVNEVKSAGEYRVDFNASGLTSGVYFYKLESNGYSDIKKMMLIK
jgi:hypothetical protein